MAQLNQPIISPLLVGREQEREYLRQTFAAARQGVGAVVLLAGEAGVGKSRLAEDARQQALADGFEVRIGQCFEGDVGYAYAPLLDAMRAWLAPLTAAEVTRVLGAYAAEVVKLLPELQHTIPALQLTAALDAEAEKRRLAESLYHVIAQTALPPDALPLLLIVEDLHWSDASSLDFLHLLARRAPTLPLVVVGTYRRNDALPHHRHWQLQLTRERLVHRLELQPLSLDEMNMMVQAIFELAQPLQPETAQWLYGLTEGNPFFVEEVLKSLTANGSIYLQDGRWARKPLEELQVPESIQDTVNRRTAWLSPDARRVLARAAVAGRRFDFFLLQHLTGYSEAQLLPLIKELVAAQLLVEESVERFAFRHALTQQAVYAGLLARERAPLHRMVGETLERMNSATLESHAAGSHAAHLAHHFYVAGEWEKTLKYAHLAGEHAKAMYEPHAAVEHWTRALVAADHLPQPPSRVPMLRGRGWAYDILGQIEEARQDFETALELARRQGNQQAEWQTLLDLGASWAAQDYERAGDYFHYALELARRSDDRQMIAHSLNRVGNWHLNLNQPHAALRYHQEALQIFLAADDIRGQATTYDFLGMTTWNCGDLLGSVRYYQQALTLSHALNDRAAMSSILATISSYGPSHMTEVLVGQPTPLNEEARTGAPARLLAQEIGWRAGEAYALFMLGQAQAYRGDYGSSLDYTREALAIAEAIDHHQWMSAAHCGLGQYYLDTLVPESARPHAIAALDLTQRTGSIIWRLLAGALLANVYLALDDPIAAGAALTSTVGRVVGEIGPVHTASDRHCIVAKARLELALGAPARALRVVDDLIATTPNIELAGMQPAPPLLLLRAKVLMDLGEDAEVEDTLRMAQAGAEAQAAMPLLWRILTQLAKHYYRQGRHVEATKVAARARETIEQVAQSMPDQPARKAFIARACKGLSHITPRRRTQTSAAAGGLTMREAEVADLIAQGYSNREIAAQLIIAERTVTTHITHIFNKLDFHTRTQIAAWVAGQKQHNVEDSTDT